MELDICSNILGDHIVSQPLWVMGGVKNPEGSICGCVKGCLAKCVPPPQPGVGAWGIFQIQGYGE